MLEIFILKALCNRLEVMAVQKGVRSWKWNLVFILLWIACELTGALIGYYSFNNAVLGGLFLGYPAGACCYFIIRSRLRSLPDADDLLETIGLSKEGNYE